MYREIVSGLSYLPRSPTKKSTKRPSKPTSPMIGIAPSRFTLDLRSHTDVTHTRAWGRVGSGGASGGCWFFGVPPFLLITTPTYLYVRGREQKKISERSKDPRSIFYSFLGCCHSSELRAHGQLCKEQEIWYPGSHTEQRE